MRSHRHRADHVYIAMRKMAEMEAVILVGIPGSGKSTFCQQRFCETHVRLNLDMLRTRRRERILLDACIAARQPFVVDNTNTTRAQRAVYLNVARQAGFRCIAYFFDTTVAECDGRNQRRTGKRQVPPAAIRAMASRLEPPKLSDGFDEIHRVIVGDGQFTVE